jgi:hypothetical protein
MRRAGKPAHRFHLEPGLLAPYAIGMEQTELGRALSELDSSLDRLKLSLSDEPELLERLFEGTEPWLNLLRYKLVPHFEGEGCLIAAVAGGTNTGKSTVFNLLLGRDVSPVRATAAATCHPVIAANSTRAAQCLDAKLVPEFVPVPLENRELVLGHEVPEEAIFIFHENSLPDRLILLDTPDVDSIDKINWQVADNIRAVGDVLIAVLTGEKYKDDRVVAFFRQAQESGRHVVPLMNKANPNRDFAVARKQLEDFCTDTGVHPPCFVIAHDFKLEEEFGRPIVQLDNETPLRAYLESLDVGDIKQRVFSKTLVYFAENASKFVGTLSETASILQSVVSEFENRTREYAEKYDPVPGKAVGGLLHEFVQQKRGKIERAIGEAGAKLVETSKKMRTRIVAAIKRRITLEVEEPEPQEEDDNTAHEQQIEQIARDLATSFIESCRNMRDLPGGLVRDALDQCDMDQIISAIGAQLRHSSSFSEDYKKHAHATMEAWWADNVAKRRALLALDALVSVAPAAIAIPVSVFILPGSGAGETLLLASSASAPFLAKVIEYQFGDAMFDLLSPWRAEQRRALVDALMTHLTNPILSKVKACLAPFSTDAIDNMREHIETCLKV